MNDFMELFQTILYWICLILLVFVILVGVMVFVATVAETARYLVELFFGPDAFIFEG